MKQIRDVIAEAISNAMVRNASDLSEDEEEKREEIEEKLFALSLERQERTDRERWDAWTRISGEEPKDPSERSKWAGRKAVWDAGQWRERENKWVERVVGPFIQKKTIRKKKIADEKRSMDPELDLFGGDLK